MEGSALTRTSHPSPRSSAPTVGGCGAPSRPSRPLSGWTSRGLLRWSRSAAPEPSKAASVSKWSTRACSLPVTDAQPEAVAAWGRGHWGIENRLHWIRDVVFDEDRHQLSTCNGPETMAALRNLAISLIRLFLGPGVSIASTTRSLSRRPTQAINLLTQPTP
ncbi:transposase [Actinomyces sp. oral taxon 171]|uniref:transposase n=1 Tax=Actinomyces sp. oral taxon 171 TaxID=706438 RepID=UPI003FA40DFF